MNNLRSPHGNHRIVLRGAIDNRIWRGKDKKKEKTKQRKASTWLLRKTLDRFAKVYCIDGIRRICPHLLDGAVENFLVE